MKKEYLQPKMRLICYAGTILNGSLTTSDKPADAQEAGAKYRQEFGEPEINW